MESNFICSSNLSYLIEMIHYSMLIYYPGIFKIPLFRDMRKRN